MYGVVVAERGVGKSPTMRVFFDPLAKIEKEEQDEKEEEGIDEGV